MKNRSEERLDLLKAQGEILRLYMESCKLEAIELAVDNGWSGDKIDLIDMLIDNEDVRDVWVAYKASASLYHEFMLDYETLGV